MTHCCGSRHHQAPKDRLCVFCVRHMKQIENITSEISDKCKTLVVQATHSLYTKLPKIKKHGILTNVFSGILQDEDGLNYKTDAIIHHHCHEGQL